MKHIIKKISLIGFVGLLLLQSIQSVEAANRKHIYEYENTYGEYYNQELEEMEPNLGEEYVTELQQWEEPSGEITNETVLLEEEEIEEDFIFIEGIDIYASLYQSTTDPNLKRMILSAVPVNYERDGNYYPIDTTLQLKQSDDISVLAISNPIYENTTNNLSSYFGTDLVTDGIEYRKDDVAIKLFPQVTLVDQAVVDTSAGTIKYQLDNLMYLNYVVHANSVEETLEMVSNQGVSSLSFQVSLENAYISISNNNITIYKDNGNIPMLLVETPVLKDIDNMDIPVTVTYTGNVLTYTFDAAKLATANYPLKLSSSISSEVNEIWTYAHLGQDISVSYNFASSTIGNPNVEAWGWRLPDNFHYEAFMYLGNNPNQVNGTVFGQSYSFYKLSDQAYEYYGIRNKYIKRAFLSVPIKDNSGDNIIYACTLDEYQDYATLNMNTTIGLISNDKVRCTSQTKVSALDQSVSINITDYVKGHVEKGRGNFGAMLMLDGTTGYLTLNAHEYYYIDKNSGAFPSVIIDYYDNPDIDNSLTVNDFTFKLRPFTKYDYENGVAHFTVFGIDGVSPLDSKIKLVIKDSRNQVIKQKEIDVVENFFLFPDYPEIADAQTYEFEESNYQLPELYGNTAADSQDVFQYNEVYTVEVTSSKGGQSKTESTWFQLYEVKTFDLLSSIAIFYGVSVETLIVDNNLQDELVIEGNVLFIREPQRNLGEVYETVDLTEDQKKAIDAALQGRGYECEFGFEPINFNTGNFLFEATDFTVRYYNESVDFTRVYNSTNADHLGIFGYGWSYFGEYYAIPNKDKSVVTVLLPDGKQYLFNHQSDGSYSNDLKAEVELSIVDNKYLFTTNSYSIYFNKNGTIAEYHTIRNEVTKYFYLNSLLYAIELPDGKTISLNYSADNLVTSINLPDGNQVSYLYDELYLIGYIDSEGYQVSYEYDENHNMTTWYNRNNQLVIINEYDENHRVVKQTDGLGNVFTLSYSSNETVVVDGEGNEEVIRYDDYGQTTSHSYAGEDGKQTVYQQGLLVEETLQNGVNYQYQYNPEARLIETLRSDGFKETFEYDNRGNLIKKSNSAGQETNYEYDSNNNQVKVIDSLGNSITSVYNGNNQLMSVTDALGNTTRYEYNADGYQSKVTYPDGSSMQYTYTDSGYISTMTDHFGETTNYTHSDRNELVLIEYPDGTTERNEYDPSGNLITHQDRNGIITRTEYNLYGNVVRSIDGNQNVTEYSYNGNQHIVQTTYPNGSIDEVIYDAQGRVVESISKGQSTSTVYNDFGVEKTIDHLGQETSYSYDALGNVVEIQYPNGTVTKTNYDSLGRAVVEIDQYGNKTEYSYNLGNQVIEVVDAQATIIKQYNAVGQVIEETRTSADSVQTIKKVYNAANQLVEQIDVFGVSTKYEYNKDRLVKVIDGSGNSTTYEYDVNGKVVKESFSSGVSHTFRYDGNGNLVEYTNKNGVKTFFTFDGNNNQVEKKIILEDGRTAITSLTYDSMNQLIKEVSPLRTITEYQYDTNKNLLEKKVNDQVVATFEYNEYNQLVSETISGLTTGYEYDSFGNRVKDVQPTGLIKEYQYNQYNQIDEIKVNGIIYEAYQYDQYGRVVESLDRYGAIESYQYNSDNNIVEKIDYTTMKYNYTYEAGSRLVQEVDSLGNEKSYQYDELGNVIQEIINDQVRTMEYDQFGNITLMVDALGNTTEYLYDGEGNLASNKNALGIETSYQYNGYNQMITKEVSGTILITNQYDLEGRLVKETDGEGNATQYQYDLFGQLILKVDAMGNPTKYEYDSNFNLIKEIDALDNTKTAVYNALNQKIKEIDALGYQTSYSYDIHGNVIKVTNPLGGITVEEYNELNQKVKMITTTSLEYNYTYNVNNQLVETNENGIVIAASQYDSYGRLIGEVNGLGATTQYVYDSEGKKIEEINALGNKKSYEYDLEDRVISEINENGVPTEYQYDALGQLIEIKINQVIQEKNQYDSFGNIIVITDANANTTTFTYNLVGKVIAVEDAQGNNIEYQYNEIGSVIEEVSATGGKIEYIYDELHQLIQTKQPEGGITTTVYDAVGNAIYVQNSVGLWSEYQYDALGNITKEIVGHYEVAYGYDVNGSLVKVDYLDGTKETYQYDQKNNLVRKIQQDGSVIVYEYNVINQLIKKNMIQYEYDLLGQMTFVHDQHGTTQMEYDPVGNMILVNRKDEVIQYTYTAYNQQESIIYPDGSKVSYQYDPAGNITKVISNDLITNYTYNDLNQIVKEENSVGLVVEKMYDPNGNISLLTTTKNGILLSEYQYQYNLENSLIQENKNELGELTVSNHAYNNNDELIQTVITKDGITTTTDYFISIEGNKVERSQDGVVQGREYNYFNQLTKYYDGTYEYTYTYDKNGNRITESRSDGKTKHYQYDEYNQLIQVIDFDLTLFKYTYDGLGNRTSQLASRVHTIFSTETIQVEDKMNILINRLELLETEEYGDLCLVAYYNEDEVDELPLVTTEEEGIVKRVTTKITTKEEEVDTIDYYTEVTEIIYINDLTMSYTEVLSTKQNGVVENYYYGMNRINSTSRIYVYDGLNNVVQDLSSTGNLLEQYEYTTYGERNIQYNPFIRNSSFGYRGEAHTYDGLQYLRARYYSTTSEVFLQEDTYLGEISNPTSRNRYTYVMNNPYKYSDPSGRSANRVAFMFVNGVLRKYSSGSWTNYTGTYQGKKYENGIELHGWVGSYYYEHGVFKGFQESSGNKVDNGDILYPSMFHGGGTPSQGGYVNPDKGTTNPTPPKPDEPEPEAEYDYSNYQDTVPYYNPPVITPDSPMISYDGLYGVTKDLIASTAASLGITVDMMRQLIEAEFYKVQNHNFTISTEEWKNKRVQDICNQYQKEHDKGNQREDFLYEDTANALVYETTGEWGFDAFLTGLAVILTIAAIYYSAGAIIPLIKSIWGIGIFNTISAYGSGILAILNKSITAGTLSNIVLMFKNIAGYDMNIVDVGLALLNTAVIAINSVITVCITAYQAYIYSSNNNNIQTKNYNELSTNEQKAYDGYSKNGWQGNYSGQQGNEYGNPRAGGVYKNEDLALPTTTRNGTPITYKEFDINAPSAIGRDAFRFVVGSDGSIYYTNDHYETFWEVIK